MKPRAVLKNRFMRPTLKPERPYGVDAGVGDCRSRHAAILAPCAAIEDSGDACHQDVAPVEVGRSFIEMREAEQRGRNPERRSASHPPFQKILDPGAKIKFLGNGNEDKDIDPGWNHREAQGVAMRMEKAEHESQGECQRRKENQFVQPGFPIAPVEVKIKARPAKAADGDESIQRGIDEKQFSQARKPARPRPLEPAQINGQPQSQENDRVSPIAALFGIGGCSLSQQPCDRHGQRRVESAPMPCKRERGAGNDNVRQRAERWQSSPRGKRPSCTRLGDTLSGESKGCRRNELQHQHGNGYRGWVLHGDYCN